MGLCLGTGQDSVKSLWVKISGQTDMDGGVVGICYRFLDQENTDESAFKQLEGRSLAFTGSGSWGTLSAVSFGRTIQYGSRRFLECVDDNFLIQMIKE